MAFCFASSSTPSSPTLFQVSSDTTSTQSHSLTAAPTTVKQIHHGSSISPHCKVENQNLVITGAKALGCKIFNIGVVDLMKCVDNNTQHLVMGMLWQLIKVQPQYAHPITQQQR